MKNGMQWMVGCFLVTQAQAATLYVDLNSTNPVPPYSSWATAATNIQNAINTSVNGDSILVAAGTYTSATEIVVSRDLNIWSTDGPAATIIDGGGTHRCLNLGSRTCVIAGFTITQGNSGADWGGGVSCDSITPVVSNCIFTGNSNTKYGGGMYQGTAIDCLFDGNEAVRGGGMCRGHAERCVFTQNSASYVGGGIYEGTANNSVFSRNVADSYGGGLANASNNHLTLNNCTFTRNHAGNSGGGISGGYKGLTANNCIIWDNTTAYSDANFDDDVTPSHCCSPDVIHGVDGNITNEPALFTLSHLAAGSPCIGAGSTNAANGLDIDGESWAVLPTIGCDEPHAGTAGSLVLHLSFPEIVLTDVARSGNCTVLGFATRFTVDFGDGNVAANQIDFSNAWKNPGVYPIVLTACNADHPNGLSITQMVEVIESTQYVATDGDDANDGTSWATAKLTIQAAINATTHGDRILVAAGTYTSATEVVVSRNLNIWSVAGPEATIIDGGGTHRCLNLGSRTCVIAGFTITQGNSGSESGGAVYCDSITPVVSNCIFTANSNTQYGGGMYWGTAIDCLFDGNEAARGGGMNRGHSERCAFTQNTASYMGGGQYEGSANNCVFTRNWADSHGGGMFGGGNARVTINNCTFSRNSSGYSGGGVYGGYYDLSANNCISWNNTPDDFDDGVISSHCCSPDAVHGVDGNTTNAPLFVDWQNDNVHLLVGSPAIDSGSNALMIGSTDFDGIPRPLIGNTNQTPTVDMGCYEFVSSLADTDADGLGDEDELSTYGTDPTSPHSDGDSMTDGDEVIAGTDPLDPANFFQILDAGTSGSTFIVHFDSLTDRHYQLLGSTNLVDAQWFPIPGAGPRPGTGGSDSLSDTNPVPAARFYRLEVFQP